MCLFFLLASVALLLYPAKRETMFLRRLRYIPHMFLFRPHMFLFRMVAFESLFVSVAVGSLLSFLHKLAGSPLLCFWFTFIVPPQVGRPLPLLCFWFTFIVPPQVGRPLFMCFCFLVRFRSSFCFCFCLGKSLSEPEPHIS